MTAIAGATRSRGYPQIRYAQCWEDPATLRRALRLSPADDVVSIASGGDNSFALLLDGPRSLTAVDANPAQLFLVELKIRAMQKLGYDDFVGFLGARPCRNREQLYRHVRDGLGDEARGYWDGRASAIRRGVIHCGKFENYFSIFRRWVLPLIHSQDSVGRLLGASSLTEQRRYYNEVWNNRRWRGLFRIFFGKFLMGRLGRDPSFFRYVPIDDVAGELLRRAARGVSGAPLRDNYFLQYILTGRFTDLENCHPYLAEANFQVLRGRVEQMRLVRARLDDYLRTVRPASLSKFNLSDIFEYISEEAFEVALLRILRSLRGGARLAFWANFVPRAAPPALASRFDPRLSESKTLFAADRTFFYGGFHVWEAPVGQQAVQGSIEMARAAAVG